jgi:Na+/H+-dicarboxylate symporter
LQPSSSLPILFDVALHCVILQAKGKETQLLGVLSEADRVFTLIIHWIMVLTPIAVFFLIASAIGEQSELAQTFKYIGFLFCFHLFWQSACKYGFMTRGNPFWYLSKMIPAQTMTFASASSAATIPTTLTCVTLTGLVNDTISSFLSFRLVPRVNMDGGCIYFVSACVWLAVLNGEEITASSVIMLILIATVESIGTAPVNFDPYH